MEESAFVPVALPAAISIGGVDGVQNIWSQVPKVEDCILQIWSKSLSIVTDL